MAKHGGKREGSGRPKGSGNVITNDLRKMVLEAVDHLNAQGLSLSERAEENPDWFYANFVKPMLPKDVVVAGDPDNPLETKVTVEFRK
jgi:hypothetical protein